jgi:hypothetical protein
MNVHRLVTTASAFLCACALMVAGCASSGAATTTQSTAATVPAGLYPVSVGGKWGYIDKTGAIKIQPQFFTAGDFSDGLAMVSVVEGNVQKCGYIDTSGKMVIQPQFDLALASPFSEGLAAVGKRSAGDDRFGFIDKTGAVVIPMQYERPASLTFKFSEGLCKVMIQEAYQQRWGFIDKTGTMVIKAQFAGVSDFSEGLAAADSGSDIRGFIDKTGTWVIQLPPNLRLGGALDNGFSDGLANVQESDVPNGDVAAFRVLQGYIDKTGKVVIEPQFDRALNFSEGLAAVRAGENGILKWGYVDKTGAWVIQPQFDAAWPFSEGLAAVATGSGDSARWSFIDKTGKVAIALPQNQGPAGLFSGGVAGVWDSTTNNYGPAAYIDTTGKVIWQGQDG